MAWCVDKWRTDNLWNITFINMENFSLKTTVCIQTINESSALWSTAHWKWCEPCTDQSVCRCFTTIKHQCVKIKLYTCHYYRKHIFYQMLIDALNYYIHLCVFTYAAPRVFGILSSYTKFFSLKTMVRIQTINNTDVCRS